MDSLVVVAARFGFVPAVRAGVDESRFVFRSGTHEVFVSSRHELHRGFGEVGLEREFVGDLVRAREWCEDAVDMSRVLRVDRIELRPLRLWEPGESSGPVGELVTLTRPDARALHDPVDWPVLDEEPDV